MAKTHSERRHGWATRVAALGVASALGLAAGAASPAAEGAEREPAPVRYGRDVRPILSNRCFLCHGPDVGSRQAGLRLDEHVFPDHHPFKSGDLEFGDDRPVIMTEKDAVKCRDFGLRNGWYAPVTIEMPREFATRVSTLLTDAG